LDSESRARDAEQFYKLNQTEMLRGTKVLWPEKETYLDHMKDMVEIGRRAFMKEKQNEPQGADDAIFERIHWYREEAEGFRILSTNALVPKKEYLHNCIAALDPATGKRKPKAGALGDFSSLGIAYAQTLRDGKKRMFVHHDYTKRVSPTKCVAEIFNLHEKFSFERMVVETNLYRELLLPNIEQEKKRLQELHKKQIQVGFYEVEQTANKGERITALEPKVNHGWILFNVALSQTLKQQFQDFPHADHDDAPDMVEMLWNLVHNRYRPSGAGISIMAGR
jgi:predicted phage terminase large subunit-like protein